LASQPSTPEKLLIVGCGYVGQHVAKLANAANFQVYALTRSETRFAELQAQQIQPVLGHWLDPNSLRGLPAVDRVLVSVPHRADQDLQSATHVRGLQLLRDALPESWKKWSYLSTTGVYGSNRHTKVNEETPVTPTRIGPEIAVAAENWLAEHLDPEKFTVLRLAGIYGPGRIPLADKLRAGEPLAVPRDGHLNLVHVVDIARAVLATLQRPMRHSLYLFSDGHPVLRETFYRYLAELCGVANPEFIAADPSSSKARRSTDKQVDPSRLVDELAFDYLFPDYRSGLVDALDT
jgi:nucleoside-diphosphate-sugar epimerase